MDNEEIMCPFYTSTSRSGSTMASTPMSVTGHRSPVNLTML